MADLRIFEGGKKEKEKEGSGKEAALEALKEATNLVEGFPDTSDIKLSITLVCLDEGGFFHRILATHLGGIAHLGVLELSKFALLTDLTSERR